MSISLAGWEKVLDKRPKAKHPKSSEYTGFFDSHYKSKAEAMTKRLTRKD
jgi:hypothetical protein